MSPAGGGEAPAISVIVPARDAAATLPLTLRALAAQRDAPPFELIVVDSGSRDATPAIAAAAGARVLRNPGGEPAGSRNLGAAHARAPRLAFIDADCAPAPGWLAAGARALEDAELVQGRVVPAGPGGPFDRTVSVGHESGLYETASLFVARAALERVGGFRPLPGLRLGSGAPFGEDVWFGWRLRRSGARSAFAPEALVHHAVFPRGPGGYVAERLRARFFPPLVALVPELRGGFLHHRLFLSPASLRFDAAVLALAAARGSRLAPPAPLAPLARLAPLAGAPYLAELLSAARRADGPLAERARLAGVRVAADAVTLGALLAGSARARTLVL